MKVEPVCLRDHVVDDDGTSVVMMGTDVLVLSALATHVLALLADGPQAVPALADQLVQTFGSPEEGASAETLVHALVDDLQRRGVVRIVTAT